MLGIVALPVQGSAGVVGAAQRAATTKERFLVASGLHPRSRFFVLDEDMHGRYDTQFSKAEPVIREGAPRCPNCGAIMGMKLWHPPYRVEVEQCRGGAVR